MAADTKREADDCAHDLAWELELPVEMVLAALAAQGLHVVTAADKAVLDACSKMAIRRYSDGAFHKPEYGEVCGVLSAEIARREVLRGS